LLPEENEAVIEALLRERKELRLAPADAAPAALRAVSDERGFLRTRPDLHDADGFFAARLERLA
jgi:16S rRNA C967 or C1407 C5-methylase (RsmB/RsmF family)